MAIFSELWKVDLGPFGNKLFKYRKLKIVFVQLQTHFALLHHISQTGFAFYSPLPILIQHFTYKFHIMSFLIQQLANCSNQNKIHIE